MSDAPATTTSREPKSVKDFLALPAYNKRFDEVLGKRAPQFMASITNAVSQSGLLARSEPRSVIAAAFVAATLDLPIDRNLGYSFLVPYAGQCQFQMGARGIVQLALRSAQYARLNAVPVNAEALGGFDDVGERIIEWGKLDETKPPVGYVVAWKLINGFVKTAYWPKEKVDQHAERYSQSFKKKRADSPWTSHYDAMALKTVVSNELKKWGILSVDMQRAFAHDQGLQRDIDAPVTHEDSALFDTGESMADALGGKKDEKPIDIDATSSEKPKEDKKASAPAPAEKKVEQKSTSSDERVDPAVVDACENAMLELDFGLLRAMNWAREQKLPMPEKNPNGLAKLPVETVNAIHTMLAELQKKRAAQEGSA